MSTADTITEAFADTCTSDAADLPDYAPIPKSALGPALNEQGYHVERVEWNLYAVTDGSFAGELIGEPSAELKTMLAGGPIRLFTPYLSR